MYRTAVKKLPELRNNHFRMFSAPTIAMRLAKSESTSELSEIPLSIRFLPMSIHPPTDSRKPNRLRHHDIDHLADPYQQSHALLTTLSGSQIQIFDDQKLNFLSVVHENRIGVWTFDATLAGIPITVKCALSPLLFSEPAIHQVIQTHCQVPAHFPGCFFTSTTPRSLQMIGFERLLGASLGVAFPALGDPAEAIQSIALDI